MSKVISIILITAIWLAVTLPPKTVAGVVVTTKKEFSLPKGRRIRRAFPVH